jgi:hypothetical protein
MCGWQAVQFQLASSTQKDGESRERERERGEKKGG